MNYMTADRIEQQYDVMAVDLEDGMYAFVESCNEKDFMLSIDKIAHAKNYLKLTKITAFRLRDAIDAMIEYMGWKEDD